MRTLLMLTLVVLMPAYTMVTAKELPQACRQECASPYGEVLGRSPLGVTAYSNCASACVVFQPNHHEGTYTGIKWQCVEYARRWLLANRGVVYGDVDYAIDIWDKIDHYRQVSTDRKIPVANLPNGSTKPPEVGDLLIYAKVMFGGTGHVAVVTGVDLENGTIQVGEQNFTNQQWSGQHARQIDLIRKDSGYWILDSYLVGWKRMLEAASG